MDTIIAHRSNKERHVGIDAGKEYLDVCLLELELAWRVGHSASGIRTLLIKLNRYALTRTDFHTLYQAILDGEAMANMLIGEHRTGQVTHDLMHIN